MRSLRLTSRATACTLAAAVALGAAASARGGADKVPITTSSEEARDLYLKGRDLAEKLRATDARTFYERAVAKDPDFALAHIGLANTAPTTKAFIDSVARAVALAGKVSEGERHIILAADAGLKGNAPAVVSHYTDLVRLFPNDERAHALLGNTYFGRQDYDAAIKEFVKATTINPSFSQPYNQLGYAYRFLDRYADAETAFKKYIELIPGDPNPHDSYAELLMKMGRFDESIKAYEKALSLDPNFVASYIGIGHDHLFAGRPDEARATFSKIDAIARNSGERRQAHFWTAASYVHEGATDKALAELRTNYGLAEAEHDAATMGGDLVLMGDVLREAGRLDEAAKKYDEAVTVVSAAQVPDEVKAANRRNNAFEHARLAVAQNDLAAAKAKTAEYAKQVESRKAPFELRQLHELNGSIALAEKRASAAVQEFKQANQQDPRILYLTAVALRDAGDAKGAAAVAAKAAKFNGLSFNYAFIRSKAAKVVSTSTE